MIRDFKVLIVRSDMQSKCVYRLSFIVISRHLPESWTHVCLIRRGPTRLWLNYEACGFGYQVVSLDPRYTKPPIIYRGLDAAKHLLGNLFQEEEYKREILDNIEPLKMTQEDEIKFENGTNCTICCDIFSNTPVKLEIIVMYLESSEEPPVLIVTWTFNNLRSSQYSFTAFVGLIATSSWRA